MERIDLWHFTTSDGRSIRKALDFMAPYADPSRKWPYQEIDRPSLGSLDLLLLRAAPVYPDAHYETALKDSKASQLSSSQDRLLFRLGTIPGAVVARTSIQKPGAQAGLE
jgi:hypothetical protein